MRLPSLSLSLRRLWALEKFGYSLRVLVALAGSMVLSWYLRQPALVIPLFLGIIASALAETDDSWRGRVVALVVTLLRSEEHTSELQSRENLVCRLLLEKKKSKRRGKYSANKTSVSTNL